MQTVNGQNWGASIVCSCAAEFISGNTKIISTFLPFRNNNFTQVVAILSRQRYMYPTYFMKYEKNRVSDHVSNRTHDVNICFHENIKYLRHLNFIQYPSQISWCIGQISNNESFCYRILHTCVPFCYEVMPRGIWEWCVVGFVQEVYYNEVSWASWYLKSLATHLLANSNKQRKHRSAAL